MTGLVPTEVYQWRVVAINSKSAQKGYECFRRDLNPPHNDTTHLATVMPAPLRPTSDRSAPPTFICSRGSLLSGLTLPLH